MIRDKYELFKNSFQYLLYILQSQRENPSRLSSYSRKTISEVVIFISDMLEHLEEMDEVDQAYAENWILWSNHVLGLDVDSNMILLIYYFEKNYLDNPKDTIENLISVMVALKALNICNNGLKEGTTEYGYFIRDIPGFRIKLKKILENTSPDENVNGFFLLLSTIDTLSYMGSKLYGQLNNFIKVLTDLESVFSESCKISPGLLIYATDLKNRLDIPISLEKIPSVVNGKSRTFLALMCLKNDIRPDPILLENTSSRSHHLWWIAQAWDKFRDGDEILGFLPFYQNLNVDMMFNLVFGNIDEILEISVTEDDTNHILTLNDEAIQTQLYNYFKVHVNVTTYSKTNLNQELKKAHTGAEISDFNVEFDVASEKIWVAMPIKSGRESRGSNDEKMQQHYLYQFIRPFLEFGITKTVVFPIILVNPTLNAHEFLSQIRSILDLPIMVINTDIYTKFLKKNLLLT